MADNTVTIPYSYFPDFSVGRPLFNADIYVGLPDLDPQDIPSNQKLIKLRTGDGTEVSVSQPVNTGSGGVISYNGSPAQIITDGAYSILVNNSNGAQVYYSKNVTNGAPITDENIFNFTGLTFTDVGNMKTGGSKVTASDIDNQDIAAETLSYYPGWATELQRPSAGAKYILTTRQRVRNSLSDPSWEPDGFGDHYLFGGTTYVATLNEDLPEASMFGAKRGDSSFDSKTYIEAMFDYVLAKSGFGKRSSIVGDYFVSSLTYSGAGSSLKCDGSITGIATVSTESVFEVKNYIDGVIDGRLVVSASYSQLYQVGVKVWGEQAQGATSLINMSNISVVGALIAWRFGDLTEPDTRLSEIVLDGGYTFGCPVIFEVIGTQTVVDVSNYQTNIVQGGWASGNWSGFSKFNLVAKGGRINVHGGEILKTADTDGAGIQLKAISSPSFSDNYGSVICTGVEIEVASALAFTTNDGVVSPVNGEISFVNCGGVHTQNTAAIIQTDGLFTGQINAKRNNFKASVTRTQPTIIAGGSCVINIDDESFGDGYVQGLQAYQGGIVKFDHRVIFNYQNSNGQNLLDSAPAAILYATPNNNEDTLRFNSNYNAGNGFFTVPAGGLKSVTVQGSIILANDGLQADLSATLNGNTFFALTPSYNPGANSSGAVAGTVFLGDLSEGTLISIVGTVYGGNTTDSGAAFSRFVIMARR